MMTRRTEGSATRRNAAEVVDAKNEHFSSVSPPILHTVRLFFCFVFSLNQCVVVQLGRVLFSLCLCAIAPVCVHLFFFFSFCECVMG